MAFGNRDKFDPPSYSECFKYFYNLDESALDSVHLILSRKFSSPLENGLYWTRFHTKCASDVFTQVIACNDFDLSDEEAGFELYAPNHFAHQFGFIQETPFPLFESLNCYTSWRLTKSLTAVGDEQDQYTVRFKGVSIAAVPIVEVYKPSTQASAPYVVWWNNVSAHRWECNEEDIFRAIFAKGKAELNLEEDQRASLEGRRCPRTRRCCQETETKSNSDWQGIQTILITRKYRT